MFWNAPLCDLRRALREKNTKRESPHQIAAAYLDCNSDTSSGAS
jgi:hypothetical protein